MAPLSYNEIVTSTKKILAGKPIGVTLTFQELSDAIQAESGRPILKPELLEEVLIDLNKDTGTGKDVEYGRNFSRIRWARP